MIDVLMALCLVAAGLVLALFIGGVRSERRAARKRAEPPTYIRPRTGLESPKVEWTEEDMVPLTSERKPRGRVDRDKLN